MDVDMETPPPPRRFKPEPIETTARTARKFVPEPVETTIRSSKKPDSIPPESTAKSVRRFAPQPIETLSRSNRHDASTNSISPKRSRFAPVLVETSSKSHRHIRNRSPTSRANLNSATREDSLNAASSSDSRRNPRKFAPQLIETAKRTRRAGDTQPALLPSDKTEATPEGSGVRSIESRSLSLLLPPDNTTAIRRENVHDAAEARRLGIPIPSRQGSTPSTRSHSFRVPDLEPIDSSQSEEESGPPSLSSSPSGSSSGQSYMYRHATRIRESVDDRYSGYLLQVAARAAEKQLREQALAAFANDDRHQPVDHFIGRDDDDGSIKRSNRSQESSFVQIDWDLREMQAHQERLSQRREQEQRLAKNSAPLGQEKKHDPWGNRALAGFAAPKDRELERMQTKARPPMLGEDIRFPRCNSPVAARFDVTQGSEALRDSMCYLTQLSQSHEDEHEGLWAKKESKKDSAQICTLWSTPSSRQGSKGGLWGGCCVNTGNTPPRGRSGLMTPHIEIGNPFDTPAPTPFPGCTIVDGLLAPCGPRVVSTPPGPDFMNIDEKLSAEQSLEEEFNDEFITQVYNYLSLGYPSIAHDFDEELAKISRISVAELRHDDGLAEHRGYIRLGKDESSGVAEESCMRWRALKLYIHEWGRQQPGMVPASHALGGFGVGAAARKGSWAI